MSNVHRIKCWSCAADVSLIERDVADGGCPHCSVELDLESYLVEAMAERDKLRAEVEALRRDLSTAAAIASQNADHALQLNAEVEARRKDAERYRGALAALRKMSIREHFEGRARRLIDAAMAAKEGA